MPGLAPVVDSLDKVPEPVRAFYEQRDGKYHVVLDGTPAGYAPAAEYASAQGKVVEFRDKNIALLQEVETLRPLKTQFDGIDPVAAKAALETVSKLKNKGVKDVDDIDARIAAQVLAAVTPIKTELDASRAQTKTERARADESVLKQTVGEKFLKAGGKPGALKFIVEQAKSAFQVVDGEVRAQNAQFSVERPGEALSVEEWIGSAAREHDFAFGASTGSGAEHKPGATQLKAGQTLLTDPTAQQLGEFASDIKAGKVKVQYSK